MTFALIVVGCIAWFHVGRCLGRPVADWLVNEAICLWCRGWSR